MNGIRTVGYLIIKQTFELPLPSVAEITFIFLYMLFALIEAGSTEAVEMWSKSLCILRG